LSIKFHRVNTSFHQYSLIILDMKAACACRRDVPPLYACSRRALPGLLLDKDKRAASLGARTANRDESSPVVDFSVADLPG